MAYTTIKKPSDYFNTKLYTGNGGTLNITGVGFQPDFTWIKSRVAAHSHLLQDAVRGVLQTLNSNDNSADDTISNGLTAFGTDGFTVGGNGSFNSNTDNYVSWNWKAGTTGSGTTGGSGTAKAYSYSVNTTAGFSIVKYAGNGSAGHTIPHHLGVVPKMIIIKDLNDNEAWRVYHAGLGNFAKWLELNSTAAETTDSSVFDNVPTSSGFLVGSANPVNNATHDYIAYCFVDVQGFSKFGSYVGNGNADGSFIYTGFKPAFVMARQSNTTNNWIILDNKRDTFNPQDSSIYPNLSNAEDADGADYFDFYSNGFKVRTTNDTVNESNGTYIYMAFAEEPLVGDNPCTAR